MLAPLLGLLAGTQHALTGPDHLAGVAPFAAGKGREAWRVGFRWGLGHAVGASCAALAALALRSRFPGIEERLSGVSEVVIGGALMFIGALGLRAAIRRGHAEVSHRHGGLTHRHWLPLPAHRHMTTAAGLESPGADGVPQEAGCAAALSAPPLPATTARLPAAAPARHRHAPFWLGTLHGAAGLSHLFAVLPALAFPGWWQPLLYLGGYGAGSLASITGFTVVLGRLLPGRSERALRLSLGAASAASVIVGAAWIALAL